ncbi:hypothetical protein E4T56_gene19588 [Termitomyces sp. T112]|nr:hypothetical protein E4T56_gene19588 [Termitomyces sp. T112]
MSAYNPTYNPTGFLTDIYGRLVPENPYAPFYPGPPTDHQEIPLGWHRPPTFSTDGNNLCIYPRRYSAALFNPTYLPPAHYYVYPVPAAAPTPLGPMDNYSPPCMLFPAQAPSPRQQRVEAYAQQCNKVLHLLRLSPVEFARCTHTLLTNLGYSDTSATPEVWADQLLNFHKRYLQGNLLETMQGTLGIDYNLQNELRTLVKEIHTSPNSCPFEDPLDPAHSFHVQCKEPVRTQNKALPSVLHQQEELNAASSILRNLNPVGGLFNQPAAHTLVLSACPWANSISSAFQTWDQPAVSEPRSQQLPPRIDNNNWTLSYIDEPGNPADKHAPCNEPPRDQPPHFDLHAPCVPGRPDHPFLPTILILCLLRCLTLLPPQWAPGPALGNMGQPPSGGPPNGGPPGGWGSAMDNFPPQHGNGNNYYYYYNAGPPLQAQNPQDDTHDALAWEGKLDIQKPEPFTSCDPQKWQIFLTQCLTMFQAKPITFQLESSQVAFAVSYLQGIAFNHYTTLLWFDPNNPMLSNWLAFTQEFLSKFGIFDTIAEAEENLFNLQMHNNKCFTTFIVWFKWEAYETGWNYNALQFALCCSLPQQIKDVLCLAPKRTTYDRYKALVTQVDQCY